MPNFTPSQKNSFKLAISVAIVLSGIATVYAIIPSETERLYIQLGNLEGQQVQLHLANESLRAQILDNSNKYLTLESDRVALRASLFPTE